MKKKLLAIGLIFVTAFAFVACDSLTDYKTTAKAQIDAHVETLSQNDYSADSWTAIVGFKAAGKADVDNSENKKAVDNAVKNAKNAIDWIENENEKSDFVLSISTEKSTVNKGEYFTVNAELKNKSGYDYEITADWLFFPHISNWSYFDVEVAYDPPMPRSRIFEYNSVIRNMGGEGFDCPISSISSNRLKKGTHELRFFTKFSLKDEQNIEIWSNRIVLTVR